MKVVKLDKRWKTYHEGFTVAMRFDCFDNKVHIIENWCRNNIGPQSFYKDDRGWRGFFGKQPKRKPDEFMSPPRPYCIVLKDEAYISAILLTDLDIN